MNCVFCKIIAGEIPSERVYEDANFVAFLDIRPLSPGHTLVIPKQHYRYVWDVPQTGAYFDVVTRIARALQQTFGTQAVHSKIIGEEVPHAHIWIYPDPQTATGDKQAFAANATLIRRALEAQAASHEPDSRA